MPHPSSSILQVECWTTLNVATNCSIFISFSFLSFLSVFLHSSLSLPMTFLVFFFNPTPIRHRAFSYPIFSGSKSLKKKELTSSGVSTERSMRFVRSFIWSDSLLIKYIELKRTYIYSSLVFLFKYYKYLWIRLLQRYSRLSYIIFILRYFYRYTHVSLVQTNDFSLTSCWEASEAPPIKTLGWRRWFEPLKHMFLYNSCFTTSLLLSL